MKENDVVLKQSLRLLSSLTFDFMSSSLDITIQVAGLLADLYLVQLLFLCSSPLMLRRY